MKISEIINVVEEIAAHKLYSDEGLHFGLAERQVSNVTVCWMAEPEAIRAAGRRGDELLIAHESLYYPYYPDVLFKAQIAEGFEDYMVNCQRRQLLEEYGLSYLRVHGTADEISVYDTFAEMLGLTEPVYADGFVKVFEIEPCRLKELVERVKKSVGMDKLRVAIPNGFDKKICRLGLPWGGLGLFINAGYMNRLIEQTCDVFIAGESDCCGMLFAVEAGVPVIETSHEVCEIPGLKVFCDILSEKIPDVKFNFYENRRIWNVY